MIFRNDYSSHVANSFTPCYGCTCAGCAYCDYSEERLLSLDDAETRMKISSIPNLAVINIARVAFA